MYIAHLMPSSGYRALKCQISSHAAAIISAKLGTMPRAKVVAGAIQRRQRGFCEATYRGFVAFTVVVSKNATARIESFVASKSMCLHCPNRGLELD